MIKSASPIRFALARHRPACLNISRHRNETSTQKARLMKRSRRVILTMMGSGAIGAISAGVVGRRDCGPGFASVVTHRLDGPPIATCEVVPAYGGFGRFPHHFDGHGHAHGGG